MLYESRGLHHHTNASVEKFWQIGPVYVRSKGGDVPLHYAYVEKERGLRYSSGDNSMPSAQSRINKEEPLLKWYQYSFELPDKKQVTPYAFRLEQQGNGFIYVNGHCIGRCWEQGPQREYYIPECWLYADKPNIITVSLRPTARGERINAVDISFFR